MQDNFNTSLILVFFVQVVLNAFVIFMWKLPFLGKYHNIYKAEQKLHNGFIPRFGGLILIVSVGLDYLLSNKSTMLIVNFTQIFLALSPLILVTLLEDTYNNILPQARLFFIFLSSALVFVLMDIQLPLIELPVVSNLLVDHPWLLIIFLVVAMVAIVNAFNFIDGVNGLLLLNFFIIFYCLKLMAFWVSDYGWINTLNLLIALCVIQLFFNFPKAFIFTGDLGAYSFGLIISVLVIIFFGQYPEFLTWQAILILFYPSFELSFTMCRRFFDKKNPFKADRLHIHQLIFDVLKYWSGNNIFSNYFTTILLIPVFSFPLFWIYTCGPNLNLSYTLFGFVINTILYLTYYFSFFKLKARLCR